MKTYLLFFTVIFLTSLLSVAQNFKISGAFVIAPGDSVICPLINRGKESWSGTGSMLFVRDSSYLVESIRTLKKGLVDGYVLVFYPNGMPKWYEQMENDENNGKIIYWDENGNISKVEYYKNNTLIKVDTMKN